MDEKQQLEKQLNVRIPDKLHRAAKVQAAKTGQPLADVVAKLLREWVAEQEQKLPTPTK